MFNIESKQIVLKFLIDSLESGDLNYFQIRKIENKEMLNLSKRKSEVGNMKLSK